ncbi:MAG: DUF2695 domain-containing protein [Mariniblastus sp.]
MNVGPVMARLDKEKRKRLLQEFKQKEMAVAFAALPLPNDKLEAMYQWLAEHLPELGCDHTRRLTTQFLEVNALPVERVFYWLDNNHGFCDCQAYNNSRQVWNQCKNFSPKPNH